MPNDCDDLAAECAVLSAVAIVETAEAAVALAAASAKCQELEDCLSGEGGEEPPAAIRLDEASGKVKKCQRKRKAMEKLRAALIQFQIAAG